MDYNKFILAIRNGNGPELDQFYIKTFEILCNYLRIHMRASAPDAEDCAQHALLATVEKVKNNAIREPGSIYRYLLQSARNRYLRVIFEQNRSNYQDEMESFLPVEAPEDILVTREEQEALRICIEKLPENSRAYINYLLEKPEADARAVAEHFGITVNNAWQKKHRIIKKLSECIQDSLGK